MSTPPAVVKESAKAKGSNLKKITWYRPNFTAADVDKYLVSGCPRTRLLALFFTTRSRKYFPPHLFWGAGGSACAYVGSALDHVAGLPRGISRWRLFKVTVFAKAFGLRVTMHMI